MLEVPDNAYYWFLEDGSATEFSCTQALRDLFKRVAVVTIPDGHPFAQLRTLPHGNRLLYLVTPGRHVVSQTMALEMIWKTFSSVEKSFRAQLTAEERDCHYAHLVDHYHREFQCHYYGITVNLLRSMICMLDGLLDSGRSLKHALDRFFDHLVKLNVLLRSDMFRRGKVNNKFRQCDDSTYFEIVSRLKFEKTIVRKPLAGERISFYSKCSLQRRIKKQYCLMDTASSAVSELLNDAPLFSDFAPGCVIAHRGVGKILICPTQCEELMWSLDFKFDFYSDQLVRAMVCIASIHFVGFTEDDLLAALGRLKMAADWEKRNGRNAVTHLLRREVFSQRLKRYSKVFNYFNTQNSLWSKEIGKETKASLLERIQRRGECEARFSGCLVESITLFMRDCVLRRDWRSAAEFLVYRPNLVSLQLARRRKFARSATLIDSFCRLGIHVLLLARTTSSDFDSLLRQLLKTVEISVEDGNASLCLIAYLWSIFFKPRSEAENWWVYFRTEFSNSPLFANLDLMFTAYQAVMMHLQWMNRDDKESEESFTGDAHYDLIKITKDTDKTIHINYGLRLCRRCFPVVTGGLSLLNALLFFLSYCGQQEDAVDFVQSYYDRTKDMTVFLADLTLLPEGGMLALKQATVQTCPSLPLLPMWVSQRSLTDSSNFAFVLLRFLSYRCNLRSATAWEMLRRCLDVDRVVHRHKLKKFLKRQRWWRQFVISNGARYGVPAIQLCLDLICKLFDS